jgi:hypothetical protein
MLVRKRAERKEKKRVKRDKERVRESDSRNSSFGLSLLLFHRYFHSTVAEDENHTERSFSRAAEVQQAQHRLVVDHLSNLPFLNSITLPSLLPWSLSTPRYRQYSHLLSFYTV